MAEESSNNKEIPIEIPLPPVKDDSPIKDSIKTNGVVDKPSTDSSKQPTEIDTKDEETVKKDDTENSENHEPKPASPVSTNLAEDKETNPQIANEDSQPTKSKKAKIQSTEIVDGLEMCVEYDSETSSSKSEEEIKPKSTIDVVEVIPNQTKIDEDDQLSHKPAKKRKRFSKRIREESPEGNDVDEKSNEKLVEEPKTSNTVVSSDDDDVPLSERYKPKQPKPQLSEDEERIRELRKMLLTTGLMFTSYRKPYGLQDTDEKKINYLEGLLKNRGIEGTPTFAKCREIRRKLESEKEVVELDPKNIYSGRRLRPKRSVGMKKNESRSLKDDSDDDSGSDDSQ